MTAVHPSGSNTFVKDFDSSGRLVVDFSRNPSDFATNRYIQIVPVKKEAGYYLEMTVEEAGRIMNTNGADFVWYDGHDRPHRNEGTEKFEFKGFKTERYDFGFKLGDKAVGQADWDIISQHAAIKAQQAMTLRTQLIVTSLTTTGNYDSSHTSAVSSITGVTDTWDVSTTARMDIKRSLNYAAKLINQDTLGVVKTKDLIIVMSPDTAEQIAVSQEIIDYVKSSPAALAQVKGEAPGFNEPYGLPDKLYGYEIVVEDAVKVTSHKGATKSTSYVMPSGSVAMVARPGDLVGSAAGGPNFSTCSVFMLEEMTVETLRDANNRKQEGHVVEDYDVVMTAPVSGFLFTGALAS